MTTKETEPLAGGDDERDDVRRRAVLSMSVTVHESRPLSAIVKVDIAAASRRGGARACNDDHYLVIRTGRSQETLTSSLSDAELPPSPFEEYGYSMLVADGLGEAGIGSLAGRIALSTIAHIGLDQGRWHLRVDPDTAMEIMDRAQMFYSRADAEVYAKSRTGPILAGMSTSLTTAYSAGDSLFIAHVGHSRAYLFRSGALTQLTRDHTMERHLASAKRPVAMERRAQDLQHILTDAIGAGGGVPLVDVEQFRLRTGDSVLLCTNGLTDVVSDRQIAEVLAGARQPAEQCTTLADMAEQQHSEDNITVVLAQYRVPAA